MPAAYLSCDLRCNQKGKKKLGSRLIDNTVKNRIFSSPFVAVVRSHFDFDGDGHSMIFFIKKNSAGSQALRKNWE